MFEKIILQRLIHDEAYARRVIAHLKPEYFHNRVDKTLFKIIQSFSQEYNAFPTREALIVAVGKDESLSDEEFKEAKQFLHDATPPEENTTLQWLVDETEKFCKDKAVYNAVMASLKIISDQTGKLSKGMIPEILTEALAVSFDTAIGHDYFEDADLRFDLYHENLDRIPFHLEYFNKITRGGIPRKTLTVIMAGTNVGKSLMMCDMAAAHVMMGYNVLYITLEMADTGHASIAERIDANLMNIELDMLEKIPKDILQKKIASVWEKTKGKLIIQEYPNASAGTAQFRHLLNELKLKKNFVPDIIYVDYINEMISNRVKPDMNSYGYIKMIASELRGLAKERDVPIITATQTNRGGYDNSDPGLTDTAESFGLPMVADLQVSVVETEELVALNQFMVTQLKNRMGSKDKYKRFIIGVDKSKMKLYDVEQEAQKSINQQATVNVSKPRFSSLT